MAVAVGAPVSREQRSRWRSGAELLPWAAGSVGIGVLAVETPMLAAGAGAAVALACLPWMLLFAGLAMAATAQSVTFELAGMTLRPDMLVTVVFALRAFTLRDRARFGRVEWFLVSFLGLQVATSAINALDPSSSYRSVALLSFGVLAFLAVSVALSSVERLLVAVRIFLAVGAAATSAGLVMLAAHHAFGTNVGVTAVETLAGFPSVRGLAYEHDLFGSTSAALAIVFLVMWLEPGRVMPARLASAGFWLCLAATVLSLARGAWVALAVGALATWLVSRAAARRVGRLIAGATLLAVVAGVVVVTFSTHEAADVGAETASVLQVQASRTLDFSGSTGARRLAEWRTSLDEVQTSPFIGLGSNSYGQRHFDETQYGPKPAFVGNWFVRFLYDSGVAGLLLFLGFAVPVAWPGRSVRRGGGDLDPLVRALVLGCVVLAVAYLATDALLLVWPWVLLGLTRVARRLSTRAADGSGSGAVREPLLS